MYGYFEIQARIGITKHLGGLIATRKLLEKCHVDDSKYVLIVGSGSGISAVKIAQLTRCRAVGIDLSAEMVRRAQENNGSGIEFMVGNAEDIPFPDNTFDAVLSESVTAFTDRAKSLPEYFRVLKPDGYLGLNEVTWLVPPTDEITAYARNVTGGLNPEGKDGWLTSMEKAGFADISADVGPLRKYEQALGELQMNGGQMHKIFARFVSAYLSDGEYRRSMHQLAIDALRIPKGFLQAFGGGLYTGKKA
jgi:arsenite methyltransferase